MSSSKKPHSPDELLDDPNWEETSHPDAKEHGHQTFENTKTGEKIRYDEAKPGATGHKAQDHWYRHNPDSTGDIDKYLDAKGNPVPNGHPDSHLYPRLGSFCFRFFVFRKKSTKVILSEKESSQQTLQALIK